MNKTISINPELFKFSSGGRGSRKKTSSSNAPGEIKIREKKEKKRTLRKNHILRFIRENQEKNFKHFLEDEKGEKKVTPAEIDNFNTDFNESLDFLKTLTTETKKKQNETLKNYPNTTTESLLYNPSINTDGYINVSNDIFPETGTDTFMQLSRPSLNVIPKYGCLKGGSLPTYRTYHNSTQKNYAPIGGTNQEKNKPNESIQSPIANDTLSEKSTRISEIKQMSAKMAEKPKKMRYPKQKRTVRRTFKVGKSKTRPNVSVLISNKTIRNRAYIKTEELKQTPIVDVRRYLTKRGFIRVGSDAPNDVLRKMYESACLICGEVQNHNPDNLLYNFLNDVT